MPPPNPTPAGALHGDVEASGRTRPRVGARRRATEVDGRRRGGTRQPGTRSPRAASRVVHVDGRVDPHDLVDGGAAELGPLGEQRPLVGVLEERLPSRARAGCASCRCRRRRAGPSRRAARRVVEHLSEPGASRRRRRLRAARRRRARRRSRTGPPAPPRPRQVAREVDAERQAEVRRPARAPAPRPPRRAARGASRHARGVRLGERGHELAAPRAGEAVDELLGQRVEPRDERRHVPRRERGHEQPPQPKVVVALEVQQRSRPPLHERAAVHAVVRRPLRAALLRRRSASSARTSA